MVPSTMAYTVDFVGYDGCDYSRNCSDLAEAQHEATNLSENGCHCIVISDVNGADYPF